MKIRTHLYRQLESVTVTCLNVTLQSQEGQLFLIFWKYYSAVAQPKIINYPILITEQMFSSMFIAGIKHSVHMSELGNEHRTLMSHMSYFTLIYAQHILKTHVCRWVNMWNVHDMLCAVCIFFTLCWVMENSHSQRLIVSFPCHC